MVADYVSLVFGVVVDARDVVEITCDAVVLDENFDQPHYFVEDCESSRCDRARFYEFPCCHEANGKKLVFGGVLKTYYRFANDRFEPRLKEWEECEKCDEYTLCERHFGQTENGYYNLSKAGQEVCYLSTERICGHCHHDRRSSKAKTCKKCGSKRQFNSKTQKDIILRHAELLFGKNLVKFLKNKEFRVYLVLNDCISCT
jgi:hypothetical protein